MAGAIKEKNALFLMSGPGKINWVDNRDIGEVSARALINTSLRGRGTYFNNPELKLISSFLQLAITVAGPEVFTNQELVEHISKVVCNSFQSLVLFPPASTCPNGVRPN